MNILFDFFPLILFFIVYKLDGIYTATLALLVATAIQLAYAWIKHRKIDPMQWVFFVLALIFGSATLLLHDVSYLKWKVSIANWVFGLGFLCSHLTKQTLLERVIGSKIEVSASILRRLNFLWGLFFLMVGFLNLLAAHYLSLDMWINFKVFGLTGLTLFFLVIQTVYLYRHLQHQSGES
ncbi:MAG: septation protein A [Gammaproteobacteria bacterium]|nr:septation protein A [Gammaproteobacteria bacterium]